MRAGGAPEGEPGTGKAPPAPARASRLTAPPGSAPAVQGTGDRTRADGEGLGRRRMGIQVQGWGSRWRWRAVGWED